MPKGVSFSDRNVGPGEDGHSARNGKRYRRPARSNSGFQDPFHNSAHLPRTKSLGMISPAEMAPRKLGTWDGVFMPVSLNILGIILFLRFGFIIGQAGLLGALFLLLLSYAIDTLTAMSLNAISTNGQVRGGGAYYLISRSLGPEFGGSIGLIFFAGQAFNAAMNVLGFVETLTDAFGQSRGDSGFPPRVLGTTSSTAPLSSSSAPSYASSAPSSLHAPLSPSPSSCLSPSSAFPSPPSP